MTTRSKKTLEKVTPTKHTFKNRIENSWVLFVKESLLENSNFRIITLPHPNHGRPAKYCLDHINKRMYEVVTFREPNRSWFIGETVKSDGSLLLLTLMNPLFLILPRLKKQCSNRAIPLDDLLSEKGFDNIHDFVINLSNIADLKGTADIKAYKYNEEKTYNWLENRVRKLAKVLREKDIHVTSGAVSATFVTSTINSDNIDEEFFLKYALGIISEYLEDEFVQKLELKFDFKPNLIETVGNKRKSSADDCNDIKKLKYENSCSENKVNGVLADLEKNMTEVKKQKPLTAKEKARQKAASGTKTISAFFTKK